MKPTLTLFALALAFHATAQVTHELQVEDNEFNPEFMTIQPGDHVHITFEDPNHTFTQVEQDTWNANGSTALPGGFNLGLTTPNPGTDFTITPTGSVWYVCIFHVSMGMKGVITMASGTGIEEAVAQEGFTLAPNPATTTMSVLYEGTAPFTVTMYDATGRLAKDRELNLNHVLSVDDLPVGTYSAEFRNEQGVLLSRQRVIVVR